MIKILMMRRIVWCALSSNHPSSATAALALPGVGSSDLRFKVIFLR